MPAVWVWHMWCHLTCDALTGSALTCAALKKTSFDHWGEIGAEFFSCHVHGVLVRFSHRVPARVLCHVHAGSRPAHEYTRAVRYFAPAGCSRCGRVLLYY